MNHFHTCQHCDDRYPGDTLLVEVDDMGGMACTCPVKRDCQVCSPELYTPLCTECDEEGDYTLATETVEGPMGRQPACQKHFEAAGERGAQMWAVGE